MRILGTLFVLALIGAPTLATAQEVSARERARIERILRGTPVIDGHNDLPWAIRSDHGNDLSSVDLMGDTRQIAPPLHTDFPRMRRGGVGGQFWSVYVSASNRGLANTQMVFEQIDLTRRMIAAYPRQLQFADTADGIMRAHRAGRIASLMGIEGGEAINNNLALLREFRRAGVTYMTLTHSATSDWADASTDAPRHGGLTSFGEEVVREMNRVGMFVDLSHVSAETMRDALAVSRAPVIFSHSSAFEVARHPRNVPDDVLALVRDNGGVVMVNFTSPFISEEFRQWSARRAGKQAEFRALNPGDTPAADRLLAEWTAANAPPRVTPAHVADHVEHIARIAGRAHIGMGADYDGVVYLPEGMEGVDGYIPLFAELLRRGWSERDIAAIAGGNLLRAMRAMERVAAEN